MPLTLHTAPVVLAMTGAAMRDGAVAVDGDRIAAVGESAEIAERFPGARVRRWRGILTPGLVNAHARLQYTDFGNLAESGLPLAAWSAAVERERAGYTEARWQESARRGVHLMLKSGTTAVADVVTEPAVLVPVARSGIGGISYVEPSGEADTWRGRLTGVLDAGSARASGVASGGPLLSDCAAIARDRGLRLQALAPEHAELGLLGPDTHAVFATRLDAAARALLRHRTVPVALCVRAGRMLDAGDAPVAALLTEHSALALGTGSLAETPSLDLWEEAAAARALARAQGYSAPDLDQRLVTAATVGGATALGLPDAGTLRPDTRADFAVFDVPTDGDPYAALITHGAGSCIGTVLAGRMVHRR
ncbi:amidohydrolase family protein [Yinghuangia aomiensis]|uniref:Amidohydrolase family protein n=1 Tax=Yinghuangia aomiensis TaxID=676205 RepID=A0ABP9HZG2_9ACTN